MFDLKCLEGVVAVNEDGSTYDPDVFPDYPEVGEDLFTTENCGYPMAYTSTGYDDDHDWVTHTYPVDSWVYGKPDTVEDCGA